MGRRIRKLWLFSWTETEAAEAYLAAQAAKGLLLKELHTLWATGNIGVIAVFEKTHPQRRKYCIDMMRTETEEDAETYLQLAEDAGWKAVTAVSGIVIYVSGEGETPVSLQTDWKSKYRLVRKSLWSFEIPAAIGTGLLLGLFHMLEKSGSGFSILHGDVAGRFAVLILVSMLCFGMLCGVRSLSYYIRSQIAIVGNRPMKPTAMRPAMVFGALLHVLCLLVFTGIFLINLHLVAADAVSGGTLKKVVFAVILLSIAGLAAVSNWKTGSARRSYRLAAVILSVMLLASVVIYCSTGITFR